METYYEVTTSTPIETAKGRRYKRSNRTFKKFASARKYFDAHVEGTTFASLCEFSNGCGRFLELRMLGQ
jgi:hypothetical protein